MLSASSLGRSGRVGPAGRVQRDEEVQALGTQRIGEGGRPRSGEPALERPFGEARLAGSEQPRSPLGDGRFGAGRPQQLERSRLSFELAPRRPDRDPDQPFVGHRGDEPGPDRRRAEKLRVRRRERSVEQGRGEGRAPADDERSLREVLHRLPSRGASARSPELLPHVPEDDVRPRVPPAADDRPRTTRPYAHLGCAHEPATHAYGEVRAVVRARCEADHGEVGLSSELGGRCDVNVRPGLDQFRARVGEHRRQPLVDGAEASRVGRKHGGQPAVVEGS